jgi:hypothetical protein
MADPMSGPNARCPWCSAPLPDSPQEHCPTCGALLGSATGADPEIKGVTTLDPEAILRARADISRPRNRFLSFITGDTTGDPSGPVSPESVAPPPDEVRREMLRLQREAERADLDAETVALKADVLAQRGIHVSELGGDEPVAEADGETAPVAVPEPDQTGEATPAEPDTPPAEPETPPAEPETPPAG